MKWSREETLKFVNLYRDHECLWNVTKPIYRNNQMRLEALQQIVYAMEMDDFSVAEARVKIKNLRNTYNQELQKIEKSIKSGMEGRDVYVPSMKWFQVMDAFVSKIKEKRSNQSNLDNQVSQHIQEESSIEADLYGDGETTNWSLNEWSESDAQLIKIEATGSYTPPDIEESTPCTSSSTGRKRRRKDLNPAASELCQVTSVTQPSDEDEFDVFGRYLALSLKKMPLHLALQCETELQATLNRYRIKAVTQTDVMASSPRSSSSES